MNLFDYRTDPRNQPVARKTDPWTSHAAGAQIRDHLPALQQWVVECVTATPGLTQRELGAKHCPDDLRRIGRRLNECVKADLIAVGGTRKCSISGRSAQTYVPKGTKQ
jgi:hypothetical protein